MLPVEYGMSDVRTAREVFGVSSLKPEQRKTISLVREGRDVMAIFCTGYGKSLCYQVPCVEMAGFVVVVTPLLAVCGPSTVLSLIHI